MVIDVLSAALQHRDNILEQLLKDCGVTIFNVKEFRLETHDTNDQWMKIYKVYRGDRLVDAVKFRFVIKGENDE